MRARRKAGWRLVPLLVLLTGGAACANRAPLNAAGGTQTVAGGPTALPAEAAPPPADSGSAPAPATGVTTGTAGGTTVPAPSGAAAGTTGDARAGTSSPATAAPSRAAAGRQGSVNRAAGSRNAPAAGGGSTPAPTSPGRDAGAMKRAATYDSGASDSEIVFGSVSSMSGILDVLRPQAARAYFSYVNDKLGGINGRKLKLLIYDDQWDVTRHAALVRQAFEQDKIFAFTAQLAFLTNRGGVPYMASHKVPVIGGEGVDLQAWGVSPFYYPQSELEAVYGGQLGGRLAVEQGCKKIASQTYNVDEGRSYADAFLKGLKAAGGPPSFVYRGENGLTETDFTAYAVQIKQAAADCVTAGMFDTHITRLKQALKQVGHPVKFVLPSTIYSPLVLESGLYDGDVGILPTDIPESAKDNPGMAEFLANVTKYEPSLKGKINGWAIKAWASAQMAVEAVKRADDNLTRANIIKILDSFDNVDLGGTVPPITFGPGPKGGQKCGAVVQVAGGQFKVLKRWYCL